MAYTFAKAQGGKIGTSLCEDDYLDYALNMIKKAEEKGVNFFSRLTISSETSSQMMQIHRS